MTDTRGRVAAIARKMPGGRVAAFARRIPEDEW